MEKGAIVVEEATTSLREIIVGDLGVPVVELEMGVPIKETEVDPPTPADIEVVEVALMDAPLSLPTDPKEEVQVAKLLALAVLMESVIILAVEEEELIAMCLLVVEVMAGVL